MIAASALALILLAKGAAAQSDSQEPGHGSANLKHDFTCEEAQLFGQPLRSWNRVKLLILEVAVRAKDGIKEFNKQRDALMELLYDPESPKHCFLGHLALRLTFYLFMSLQERAERLREEPSVFALEVSVTDILESGWPIFGILGLLAQQFVKHGYYILLRYVTLLYYIISYSYHIIL